jgi:hypothetical protein
MVATAFAWALLPVLVEDPSPLAIVMFWCAICLVALLPNAGRFTNAWRWTGRLGLHLISLIVGPVKDVERLHKTRTRWRVQFEIGKAVALLALPFAGAAIFIGLFASANPIVAEALNRLSSLLALPGGASTGQMAFWGVLAAAVWSTLRPQNLLQGRAAPAPAVAFRALPGVSTASVTLSLILFNAIFAVENALDLLFLWSGAPLPEGVTLAHYAHRGAYPLIATALLAGAFVLIILRPGSPLAANKLLRTLILLWIAQNVFLVASSALRTIDYVEAYSLTRLRLAALIWMALVALGLGLICWRMLKNKSGAWLINANALAVVATLSVCLVVDLGSVAATWNVRHNALVGGGESVLDVGYLECLGPSALDAMLEFERNHHDNPLTPAVSDARRRVAGSLAEAQSDWRSWTFRGARRLQAAQAAEASAAQPAATPEGE